MIYDYRQEGNRAKAWLSAKYDWHNVEIKDHHLVMKQRGFSQAEFDASATISIAGLQTQKRNMLHGSYRTVFNVEGSNGGACAGFFWYHVSVTSPPRIYH